MKKLGRIEIADQDRTEHSNQFWQAKVASFISSVLGNGVNYKTIVTYDHQRMVTIIDLYETQEGSDEQQ